MVSHEPGLGVSVEEAAGQVTVSFQGDVDLGDAARIEEALHDAVSRCETGVSVDLTDTTFLGSTGVRLMLAAAEQARCRGVGFWLVPGEGPARRVVDLLGLRDVVEVRDAGDVRDPQADGSGRDGRV